MVSALPSILFRQSHTLEEKFSLIIVLSSIIYFILFYFIFFTFFKEFPLVCAFSSTLRPLAQPVG